MSYIERFERSNVVNALVLGVHSSNFRSVETALVFFGFYTIDCGRLLILSFEIGCPDRLLWFDIMVGSLDLDAVEDVLCLLALAFFRL